jgi:hypothetical protein
VRQQVEREKRLPKEKETDKLKFRLKTKTKIQFRSFALTVGEQQEKKDRTIEWSKEH